MPSSVAFRSHFCSASELEEEGGGVWRRLQFLMAKRTERNDDDDGDGGKIVFQWNPHQFLLPFSVLDISSLNARSPTLKMIFYHA